MIDEHRKPVKDLPGWERQTLPTKGAPYGWIQWKGTRVCMDFTCSCGGSGHIDQDFTYYIRCVDCGQVYMANGHVEMVPLTPDEVAAMRANDGRVVPSDREDSIYR